MLSGKAEIEMASYDLKLKYAMLDSARSVVLHHLFVMIYISCISFPLPHLNIP